MTSLLACCPTFGLGACFSKLYRKVRSKKQHQPDPHPPAAPPVTPCTAAFPRKYGYQSTVDLSVLDQPLPTTESKAEMLSHALHLARLAVILDKAEIYTGASRAYFDCCQKLASIEYTLEPMELEVAHHIGKTYKRRLSEISAITRKLTDNGPPLCAISLPAHLAGPIEIQTHHKIKGISSIQITYLNRICQLLHTLDLCYRIIQDLDTDRYGFTLHTHTGEGLLRLAEDFAMLQDDINLFKERYTRQDPGTGARGVLYALLGNFRRKVDNFIENGEYEELVLFLLTLFDIKFPMEFDTEEKRSVPLAMSLRRSKADNIGPGGVPVTPLTPGPSVKFATAPAKSPLPIRLGAVPIPRRSSKRKPRLYLGRSNSWRKKDSEGRTVLGKDEEKAVQVEKEGGDIEVASWTGTFFEDL